MTGSRSESVRRQATNLRKFEVRESRNAKSFSLRGCNQIKATKFSSGMGFESRCPPNIRIQTALLSKGASKIFIISRLITDRISSQAMSVTSAFHIAKRLLVSSGF